MHEPVTLACAEIAIQHEPIASVRHPRRPPSDRITRVAASNIHAEASGGTTTSDPTDAREEKPMGRPTREVTGMSGPNVGGTRTRALCTKPGCVGACEKMHTKGAIAVCELDVLVSELDGSLCKRAGCSGVVKCTK